MQVDKIYFIHLREKDQAGQYINNSGITFAWKVETNGRLVIGKPAVCWETETFVKSEGRRIALDNFDKEDALFVIQPAHIKMLATAQLIAAMSYDALTPKARLKLVDFVIDAIDDNVAEWMTTNWFEGLVRARFTIQDGHLRHTIHEAESFEVQGIMNSLFYHNDLEAAVNS